MSKSNQYWDEVRSIAAEIRRLSNEIQGPLIDEHVDPDVAADMDIEELTNMIAQFYTPEQEAAWKTCDVRGVALTMTYQIPPEEVSSDIWSMVVADDLALVLPSQVN